MIKTMILAAALVAAAPAAASNEWTYLGTTTTGSTYYMRTIDYQFGRSDHRNGRAWVKSDDRKNTKVSWSSSMVLYAIDCVSRTTLSMAGTYYYADGTHTSEGRGSVDYTRPESMAESMVDAYCSDPGPMS